jgi:hypothetical protein
MEWVPRLVETGIDGQSRSSDVMAIRRPDGLGDLASLGLTLVEAKQLLAPVQRVVVAARAGNHAMFRPDCQSCGGRCHMKDWRSHRIATVCGEVTLKLPRFLCAGCDLARPVSVGWRIAGQHPSWISCGPGFPHSCHIGLRLTCCCTCGRSAPPTARDIAWPHAARRQADWRCGDGEAAGRGVSHRGEAGCDLHTRP